MTQLPEGQSVSESREVGSRVLNAMAGAFMAVAGSAFLVMFVIWLASGHDRAPRVWPAAGWLVCVPAFAAALALQLASESLSKPRPEPRDSRSHASGGAGPTPPVVDREPT